MKTMFIITAFLSLNSFAHIEVGTHEGITTDGKPCSMVAGQQTFLNNTPHPLNERIKVTYNGVDFEMQHPPVIDPNNSIAHFNHDAFQATNATRTGAQAFWINMSHEEGKKGPVSFVFIDHKWKNDERSSVVCNELKFKN